MQLYVSQHGIDTGNADNIKEAIELLLEVRKDDMKDILSLSTTRITRIEIANVT